MVGQRKIPQLYGDDAVLVAESEEELDRVAGTVAMMMCVGGRC